MSRRVGLVAAALATGVFNVALVFFVPDDFARVQAPWMLAVTPMFVVGAFLTLRAVGNPIGRLVLVIAFLGSFGNWPGLGAEPGGDWFGPVGAALSTFGIGLLPLLILLFPDGRVPSPRWRYGPVLIVAGAAVGATSAFLVGGWGGDPAEFVEPGVFYEATESLTLVLTPVYFAAYSLGAVVALASLVARYRAGSAGTRHQLRWLLAGTVVLVIALLIYLADRTLWSAALLALGMAAVPIAIAFAVLRYRLYDIDIVISRALVYGSLAVFIGGVYIAIVVGVGALVGGGLDEPNPGLALTATVLVAVAFQPLRRHLTRLANRLVYGRLATPYEVLSEFAQNVAATDDSVLTQVTRSLVEGTGAEHVALAVRVGDGYVETARWPAEAPPAGAVDEASFPVSHDGEELGRLTLAVPRGQVLGDQDRRLAAEVASGLGLALRNQRLTEALQRRVDELGESRRRLVEVQDETRRTLERDLHDGAQQQLVALKVKLGLARTMASKDGAERTVGLLEGLGEEADGAVDALRDFARGVYPPLLESDGLGVAIAAQARRAPVAVRVDAEGLGRYGRQVEATVYFCVLEALQNVAKYAGASEVRVAVHQVDGKVQFTVRDDGVGFLVEDAEGGSGLTNMADRLGSVGGTLHVESAPGHGTTVAGAIPLGGRDA